MSKVQTYGQVWFYTEHTFLEEIITPYYDKLRLGPKPFNLQEFAHHELPPLPKDIPGYAEPGAMYEHLKRYHTHFNQYCHLLKEASSRTIQRHQIREYVAQDTPDGQRSFFNYLAVKEVKITCAFPYEDVGQIALVDMPGLGDTGIGDEERLIKTLGKDIDFVLFVRMPKSSGDYWGDVDVRLYDTARSALTDLPIDLWSFMVLNRLSNGENTNNCQDLLDTIEEKRIKVQKSLMTNCADPQETRKVLDTILDYLTDNLEELDRQYASSSNERLQAIYEAVQVELKKTKDVFRYEEDDSEYQETEELFADLFGDKNSGWWHEIVLALQTLIGELWTCRQMDNEALLQGVKTALQHCEKDKGILSSADREDTVIKSIKVKSVFEAYADYRDELRVLISHRFLPLDGNLNEIVESVKKQVSDILKEEGKLAALRDAEGSEFFKAIYEIIDERFPKIKEGFGIIADFQLSYRGLILPRIRQYLDPLTNISSENNQQPDKTLEVSRDTTAEEILTALEIDYDRAVNTIVPVLEELLSEPNQAAYAMVEEFVDNVIRQKDAQKEWKNFLRSYRGKIWPEEFGKREKDKQMAKQWKKMVDKVIGINMEENYRLL